MANLELQIISNIIRDGTVRDIQRRGITSELFQSQEGREMFRWILDEFTNPRHPGVVPSLDRAHRFFPDFDYSPSRDSLSVLVDDLVSGNVAEGVRNITEEIDALIQDGEDPQLVLQAYLPQLRDLNLFGNQGRHLMLSESAQIHEDDFRRMQEAGGLTGIPFPWKPLNFGTAGMQDEDFIVIYGRPKNMKTWTACAIAAHAYAKANRRVLVYSKEMSTKIMSRRVASIVAEVDYQKLKSGQLPEDEAQEFFEVMRSLKDWEKSGGRAAMTFLSDRDLRGKGKGATVDMISAEAEKFEADMVLVDGFYLMKDGRTGVRSRDWKQIANISSDLKEMAQHLSVPVIGTTQANRGANQGRGDDLDELGFADAIGQDADLVMRVFKGMNRRTGKPKIMVTFPGVRDAVLYPFVINAWPGVDFSLFQSTVDVEAFLKDKEMADEEEDQKHGMRKGKDKAGGPNAAERFGSRRKRGKKNDAKANLRV